MEFISSRTLFLKRSFIILLLSITILLGSTAYALADDEVVTPTAPTNLSATCTGTTMLFFWTGTSGTYTIKYTDLATSVVTTTTGGVGGSGPAATSVQGVLGHTYSWSISLSNGAGTSPTVQANSNVTCSAATTPTSAPTNTPTAVPSSAPTATPTTPVSGIVCPVNLASYWDFENSGTTISPKIGSISGSSVGTTTVPGKIGNGRKFTNTSGTPAAGTPAQYIDFGNNFSFDRTTPFSMGMWVNIPSTVSGDRFIFSKQDNFVDGKGYNLSVTAAGTPYFTLINTQTNNRLNVGGTTNLKGGWHYVVVSYDGASAAKLFVDGVQEGSATSSTFTGSITGSESFMLGAREGASFGLYDGVMDELGIWNKALSASEVTYLYNAGSGLSCTTTGPLPTQSASCELKPQGDANCDGKINLLDFNQWKTEFLGTATTKLADFNSDNTINLLDFNMWKTGFLNSSLSH